MRSLYSNALNTLGDHSRVQEGQQILFYLYGLPQSKEVYEDYITIYGIEAKASTICRGKELFCCLCNMI